MSSRKKSDSPAVSAKGPKRWLQCVLIATGGIVVFAGNAVTEGLNSKIQALKANARGFRSFANYRTRILFFCGKLDLNPL